ncbi:MAG: FAD binding domain-containing protein [Bacteroidia bacterium]|nr:FAD binding domain-containing protein [Bacteroidia bacterium]
MIAEKKYHLARSVQEALELTKMYPSFRYLAGGTDAIVNTFQGNDSKDCLIDLSGITELHRVETAGGFLKIGSLVTLDQLHTVGDIAQLFPALLNAAQSVASPVIRKTATIGGNLLCENRCTFFNQSAWWRKAIGYCLKCDGDVCIATGGKKNCFSRYVSDTAPVLIALNARIEIASHEGTRIQALEDLFSGHGIHPRLINGDDILLSILLPLHPKQKCVFKKLRPREAMDFSSLSTAVAIDENMNVRIVMGAVDPGPVLLEAKAPFDFHEVILNCVKKPRIVENDVYSRTYRKDMIGIFLRRSFEELNIL